MSPRPAQPAAETEAKKAAIIQAILDQIVDRGPTAVRMADVAKAVGMSVGTVQYYFGSRDALLAAAFSAHSDAVLKDIADMANHNGKTTGEGTETGSPRSRLHAAFTAVHEVGNHGQRSRIWIELVTAARTHSSLQDCVDSVFEGWRSLFSRIIDDGIRTGDFTLYGLTVTEVVDTFIAIIDGFDLAAVAGQGPEPTTMARILGATADGLLSGGSPGAAATHSGPHNPVRS